MPLTPGSEPIDGDEVLYRRIPVSRGWYSQGTISPDAFDPRDDEETGISIYRAKYKSLSDVGNSGKGKQGYFVAEFRAGDLMLLGISVEPRPELNDPGHSELSGLTCRNRDSDDACNLKKLLTSLAKKVHGPFVQPS